MVLLNRPVFVEMLVEAYRNPLTVVLSGFVIFVAGLAIVRNHIHWAKDWTALVTLIGWLAIIGGLARIMFPIELINLGAEVTETPYALPTLGVVLLALGGFLSFQAYRRA
jgi:hypothetical protein